LRSKPKGIGPVPFDSSLREAVADRLTVHPDDCAAYAVAGCVPTVVASPKSFEQAAAALRAAGVERARVAIRGRGTKSDAPPRPRALDVVLDVSGCGKTVDIQAEDLTARVSAGARMADLETRLAACERFFPCDVPFIEGATVGGTISAGRNGALGQRFGGLRDNVLGLRIALADGSVSFAGSHVVKSVAGYDSHKLFIGARGTLGLVGEAILKLAPSPPDERALVARFRDAKDAVAAAIDVASAPIFPYASTLHDPQTAERIAALAGATRSGEWLAVFRCGGLRRALAKQLDDIMRLCKQEGCLATETIDKSGVRRAWSDVAELAGGAAYPAANWIAYRISCLPSRLPAVIDAALNTWPSVEITAHPALGALFVHLLATAISPGGAPALGHARLWEAVDRAAGHAVCTSAPVDVREDALPPRSYAPYRLLRRLKDAFDPDGVLDPGRLPGGI
jgi:glycolate oxidase FAD binding subunit